MRRGWELKTIGLWERGEVVARRRRVGDEVIVAAPERALRGKKTRKYKKRTRNTGPEICSISQAVWKERGARM